MRTAIILTAMCMAGGAAAQRYPDTIECALRHPWGSERHLLCVLGLDAINRDFGSQSPSGPPTPSANIKALFEIRAELVAKRRAAAAEKNHAAVINLQRDLDTIDRALYDEFLTDPPKEAE